MSLVPLFSSPCDLARRMPSFVADFLDLEASLRRRFREESVSDLFVAALVRLADPNLLVFVPEDEKVTGNDFDILIFDPVVFEAVQYRIQAKRLRPHKTNWKIGSYSELAHPHGTGAQSLSLIKSAAAEKIRTVPLYAFYNPAQACTASGGAISGIELASGKDIRTVVRTLIKAKPKRPPLKRVGNLQPLFFPLTTILCPEVITDPDDRSIPRPADSYRAITAAIEERQQRFDRRPPNMVGVPRKIYLPPEDADHISPGSLKISGKLPAVLRQAIARRDAEGRERIIHSPVKRPKVVLLSQGPSRE